MLKESSIRAAHFFARSAFAVAVLAPACAADQQNDEAAFRGQIQAGRSELARHHDAALRAPTLADFASEAAVHDTRMGSIMAGMNGMMGGMMGRCSDMDRMRGMMSAMDSEMEAHATEVDRVAALDQAVNACTAHTHRMGAMFDDMEIALGDGRCMAHH